ncbi:S41 family peptidase [Spirosoma gilvum]
MNYPILLLFCSTITLQACTPFIDVNKSTLNPKVNFEVLWKEFDENYAYFTEKKLDWQAIHNQYSSKVSTTISQDSLFTIFTQMLSPLQDGHVTISGYKTKGEDFNAYYRKRFQRNYYPSVIENGYLENKWTNEAGNLVGGTIKTLRGEVGYIAIKRFSVPGQKGSPQNWVNDFALLLDRYRNLRGLLIDVRGNGGGNYFNSIAIANQLVTTKQLFAITRTKNGKGSQDFSSPTYWYTEPAEGLSFTKPIALLTNRYTFSATEWFVMAMKNYSHVIQVGDTTGGGLGSKLQRTLPNGWLYSLSVQKTTDKNGVTQEASGFAPDYPAATLLKDSAAGKDPIIDIALLKLPY